MRITSALLLLATVGLAGFLLYFSYATGFDGGYAAAQEACGSKIISLGVQANGSVEDIKSLISVICYGGN